MITTYTCRHCKAQCPPFENDPVFTRLWLSTCKHCGTKYRIAGDSQVVEEVGKRRFESSGFIVNDKTPFVLPSAEEMLKKIRDYESTEAQKTRADAAVIDNFAKAVRLSFLAIELKEAEQAEDYEKCAELRDKIKQLEK